MSIKEEIKNAIIKSLESEKLFILSMTNLYNKKLGFEDRLTYELASNISNGFAIPQYKIKNSKGENKYIDIVKFRSGSKTFEQNDIEWILEAKILYSYQKTTRDAFIKFSIGGPGTDRGKLEEFQFKKIILFYQIEVYSFEGDFEEIKENYPSFKYHLKDEEEIVKNNLKKFNDEDFIGGLLFRAKEIDPNIKKDEGYGFVEKKITNNENSITLKIHYFICEV